MAWVEKATDESFKCFLLQKAQCAHIFCRCLGTQQNDNVLCEFVILKMPLFLWFVAAVNIAILLNSDKLTALALCKLNWVQKVHFSFAKRRCWS